MISQPLGITTGPAPLQPQVQVGQPGWQDGALARLAGPQKANMPNADVGGGQRGFVVDVNGDGQYGRGQDAVLGMDFDGDGNLNQKEISRTRELMSSFGGNNDFNGDGKVSKEEKKRAAGYRQLDRDRDGNGKVGAGEVAGLQNFSTNNPLNTHSLNGLDPTGQRSSVSSTVRPPSRAPSRANFF